jgi:hypothetical protein
VVLFVKVYDKSQVNQAPEGSEEGGGEGGEEGGSEGAEEGEESGAGGEHVVKRGDEEE